MAERDKVRIHFICEANDGNSPSSPLIEHIASALVEPAIPSNIEYELERGTFHGEPGQLEHYTVDMMASDDLVIADLSDLGETSYFILGARIHKGLPIVYICDESSTVPYDFKSGLVVRYSLDDPELSILDLREEIERALAEKNDPRLPQVPVPPLPPREMRLELANRIEATADVIRALRINSVSESVDELTSIANDLKQLPDENSPLRLQEGADKALKVIFSLLDQLSSQQGARMAIAGAIALIVGGTGVSGVTAFGGALAFWYGQESFTKFLDGWSKRSAAPKRRTKKT